MSPSNKHNKTIVANWKMNPDSYEEAISLIEIYLKFIYNKIINLNNINFIIAPPAVYLQNIYLKLKQLNYHNNISLCAQNIAWEKKGAFTGELSGHSLNSIGCKYTLLGHSERRLYNYETDELIAKKVSIALSSGLIPIVCIGETKEEFNNKDTRKVLEQQLNFLKEVITVQKDWQQDYYIAYEPVWAIGSGKSADVAYIQQVNNYILNICRANNITNVKILYGGSVSPNNAKEIIGLANNSGLLIGGASLNAEQFLQVCENII